MGLLDVIGLLAQLQFSQYLRGRTQGAAVHRFVSVGS